MSLSDSFDDADDASGGFRRPDSKPRNVGLFVGLAVVGAMVAIALLGGTFALFARRAAPKPAAPPPVVLAEPVGVKRVYTRAEFSQLVIGKTPEEIETSLGKPNVISEAAGEIIWTYFHPTVDPENGAKDAIARIHFEKGKAVRIKF